MVERVGEVQLGQQRPGVPDHRGQVAALVEGVRRAVQERDQVGVDARGPGRPPAMPSSTKSSGCGSRTRRTPSRSKIGSSSSIDRQNWASLCGGRLRPAVELGVHHGHPEIDGDLDGPLPVAHRRLPLVLVRAGPLVERQHRGDLDLGRGQRLLERRDAVPVHPRVQEERHEVVARRQLDVPVAEVGDQPGQLEQRHLAQHVRVERDLHARHLLGVVELRLARPGPPRPARRCAAPRRRRRRPRRRRSRPRRSGPTGRPPPAIESIHSWNSTSYARDEPLPPVGRHRRGDAGRRRGPTPG